MSKKYYDILHIREELLEKVEGNPQEHGNDSHGTTSFKVVYMTGGTKFCTN